MLAGEHLQRGAQPIEDVIEGFGPADAGLPVVEATEAPDGSSHGRLATVYDSDVSGCGYQLVTATQFGDRSGD